MKSKLTLLLVSYILMIVAILSGCSRKTYRLWADHDAQYLIESRQTEQWQLPARSIDPDPTSRLADISNPDCPDLRPPDDLAAANYMSRPYKFRNQRYWDRFLESESVDQGFWWESLPLNAEKKLVVDRDLAVELALLHNRDYQTTYEQLWLTALDLANNRYDFANRWFGGNDTNFNAAGDGAAASRVLAQSRQLGLSRNLAAGGQLITSFANSVVWQLGGTNSVAVGSNLVVALTQPLLRGAFRHVRLENLTQSERTLLYGVRDFVRFRREFYLTITRQYLSLLTTLQSLRNQRSNLDSLELNLLEHQELANRQLVATIQVDQVFQDYQSGRLRVLSAEQSLQDELDAFKFLLGLPPDVPIEIDETFLAPFELNDPKLDQLQAETDLLYKSLLQFLPPEEPPQALLDESMTGLSRLLSETQEALPAIQNELQRWKQQLESDLETVTDRNERLDLSTQQTLAERIEKTLDEVKVDLVKDIEDTAKLLEEAKTSTARENWEALQRMIGQRLRDRIVTLFVSQNQIRLFLIELVPCDIGIDFAIEQAVENRLDLMNQKAIVTDSFRNVEIAADQLESDLGLSAQANLGSDPDRRNPLRLDSSAADYQLSLQFDGPLDRYGERNSYRAAQINYQRQRRIFMAAEDDVKNRIRSAVRELNINRLNFQIARQQLITATRQVEEARFNLRTALDGVNSSLTRDLLQALQGLLGAKNDLISSWISYEVSRISLFVEMELLYLDDRGLWANERYNPKQPNDSVSGFNDGSASAEPNGLAPPEPKSFRR